MVSICGSSYPLMWFIVFPNIRQQVNNDGKQGQNRPPHQLQIEPQTELRTTIGNELENKGKPRELQAPTLKDKLNHRWKPIGQTRETRPPIKTDAEPQMETMNPAG